MFKQERYLNYFQFTLNNVESPGVFKVGLRHEGSVHELDYAIVNALQLRTVSEICCIAIEGKRYYLNDETMKVIYGRHWGDSIFEVILRPLPTLTAIEIKKEDEKEGCRKYVFTQLVERFPVTCHMIK